MTTKSLLDGMTSNQDRSAWISIALSIIAILVYLLSFKIAEIRFIGVWPDIVVFIVINILLGGLWWGRVGVLTDKDRLTLGQASMGGAVQAGIIASSIFIPLSLTAIQIAVGPLGQLTQSSRPVISNLVIGVFWFGLSTIFGVMTLIYTNQMLGEGKDVLNSRLIGIPTNIQFYAMVMGITRVLYSLYLMWSVLGLGVA